MAANTNDQSKDFPLLPPLKLEIRVSAAAMPSGNLKRASSIRYLRIIPVNKTPNIAPLMVIHITWQGEMFSPRLLIQTPGIVNARPPATSPPADMAVCATFTSFIDASPISLRMANEVNATKTVGHGKAPIFNAMYVELSPTTIEPIAPTISALTVSSLCISKRS